MAELTLGWEFSGYVKFYLKNFKNCNFVFTFELDWPRAKWQWCRGYSGPGVTHDHASTVFFFVFIELQPALVDFVCSPGVIHGFILDRFCEILGSQRFRIFIFEISLLRTPTKRLIFGLFCILKFNKIRSLSYWP